MYIRIIKAKKAVLIILSFLLLVAIGRTIQTEKAGKLLREPVKTVSDVLDVMRK